MVYDNGMWKWYLRVCGNGYKCYVVMVSNGMCLWYLMECGHGMWK